MPSSIDLLLRNAVIFDGTGAARHHGDVALAAGRIAAVGRLEAVDAQAQIDLRGRAVAGRNRGSLDRLPAT